MAVKKKVVKKTITEELVDEVSKTEGKKKTSGKRKPKPVKVRGTSRPPRKAKKMLRK